MSEDETVTAREVVGVFKTRSAFEAAVEDLTRAGFESGDLSVLTSHESLAAAGEEGETWRDALTNVVGDIRYEGPLVASGLIVLAGGPMAAALAGVVGAAVGGLALKELFEEVSAKPHTDDFARAVEAGAIVLWVRAGDDARETAASDVLIAAGAENVHAQLPPGG